MPEPALQEKATQEAARIYSNEYLKDDTLGDYPYIGAWRLHPEVQQVIDIKFWITSAVDQEDPETSAGVLSGNENSFTQADLLNNEDNQVQQLIFQIRISTSIPNSERLANRLNSLFNAAKEEDPDSPGISVDSIHSFYHFLQKHTNLKYPIITLTPDNDIYASWKGGLNQVFSVHFVSNENTYFVIFKPNENNPERKIISYGTDTADTLLKTVASTGICDWISDER
ncbi:MAG: hypothetical protein HQ543_00865 [Bacteroidetes bacterium]|nr:hypothetical protein [Bacteroidota bacterium]